MSFHADWMPLPPLMDEEIPSTGVSVKEELREDISEDTCLEIKEEQFDYADKKRDEVSDVKGSHECLVFHNLHDLRHEANDEKDSCNLAQNHDDVLRVPLIVEDYGNQCSSDQGMHTESHTEDIEPKWKRQSYLVIHVRVHTKEKPYTCEFATRLFTEINLATMSFLADWMLLATHTDDEILSRGVSVKEEHSDDVTEETCLEIKEEPFDYECHDETVFCVPFVADEYGNKCLSDEDEAMHKESLKEDTQVKVEASFTCFTCDVCGEKFSEKSDINIHMRVHTKKKPYSCDICNKGFPSQSDLTRHVRVHTKEKPYSCEFCSKAFSERSNLVCHIRVHTKEKPYSCEICTKSFSCKSGLVKHMRVHTKEKPYNCEICKKDFAHKTCLVSHMKIHTNEKPYSCEICNKAFSEKNTLVRHMRVHTKEKPCKCEICYKAFAHRKSLLIHMKGHTEEKPYDPEVCDKDFSDKTSLESQMRVHTVEKPYNLRFATRTFHEELVE
ncbi:zinc finger protein 37-like [Penaeus monodon]|uniref:zinc finger protein 37-like n=1 Tax=Penaeus monodon TaxID=6687 RepID=UPI0018A763B6|nr:zinc finger protein 37-like [Penaeus monodon]